MKRSTVYAACSLLVLFIATGMESTSTPKSALLHSNLVYDGSDVEDELESEVDMKKLIGYVAPLMAVFNNPKRNNSIVCLKEKSSGSMDDDATFFFPTGRASGATGRRPVSGSKRPTNQRNQFAYQNQPQEKGFYDYDEYGGSGGYAPNAQSKSGGYGGGCGCGGGYDLTSIVGLALLGLLALYLIYVATTTTTAGRRRRSNEDNDLIDFAGEEEIDFLDAPTWISMVEQIWNEETENGCALKALCRMNRIALNAPGSVGTAVSLSSLPMSFLLHKKHQSGFMSYLDASLMGRNLENCTAIFDSCPRLH